MRKHSLYLIVILCLFALTGHAQQAAVAGYIQDAQSGERLIGATVVEKESQAGALSNEYGFFSLRLPAGRKYILEARYVGYEPYQLELMLAADTTVLLRLTPSLNQLQEVEVRSQRLAVKPTDGSVAVLSAAEIKRLPRLLGEADPLRGFQLLPGIQSGPEGSSALYVRGGSPDQNLILLDDVPLYFVNHLGGFLSVIDPNAINAIKLYKGGFPARFGGRLSSVLDIRMKDGNLERWERNFSLGLLSTKASVSGPLVKEKVGVMATVRRSNLDLLSRLAALLDTGGEYTAGFYFYDATAKIHYNVSKNDRVSASFYAGQDRFFLRSDQEDTFAGDLIRSQGEINNQWGNLAGALRWNHTFSESLFGSYTLSFSRFRYLDGFSSRQSMVETQTPPIERRNELFSDIQDVTLRLHHEWNRAGIWRFGALATLPRFGQPGLSFYQQDADGRVTEGGDGGGRVHALSSSLYVEREVTLWDSIQINAGLHNSFFLVQGAVFPSLQPRLVVTRPLASGWLLKASYARMVQNQHLLSNSGAGPPTDLWVPATKAVGPGTADQVSFGGRRTWADQGITLEAEAYYKRLRGQLDFSQGTSFFAGEGGWENKVESRGKGAAYGLELLVQKETEKFSGWLSYTWSRNLRRFENINGGRAYPYLYDRPHVLTLVGIWEPSPRSSISATWTVESGRAVTLASARYEIEAFDYVVGVFPPVVTSGPQSAYLYEGRNNYRMPVYHRLDVNFNLKKAGTSRGKKYLRVWSLGVYNLYNRQNPYFLFYDRTDSNETKLFQFTLFPVLPYFSYERSF